MLMPGATETDAALAANVIVRASFDSVLPGNCGCPIGATTCDHLLKVVDYWIWSTLTNRFSRY